MLQGQAGVINEREEFEKIDGLIQDLNELEGLIKAGKVNESADFLESKISQYEKQQVMLAARQDKLSKKRAVSVADQLKNQIMDGKYSKFMNLSFRS